MSEPVTPSFLSWLRSGLAASITTPAVDGLASSDTTTIAVKVNLQASGQASLTENVQSPALRLRGPGEVTGIDPALITRREPQPGSGDAESNYLALIEFSAPDFPWRYTPAAPSAERLQPWIVLVVVEEREGIWLETGATSRLPVLHVDDAARELPDLRQSWAWAHVQADCDLAGGVSAALDATPEAFHARLLCPRRLLAKRSWLACLVPTFEAGRRAGLGEALGTNLGLSWDAAQGGSVNLPVYSYWRFQTGPSGDFESLVRRLKPRELSAGTGLRDLDISAPGGGLPAVPGALISYQGALVSTDSQPRAWPPKQKRDLKNALRKTLNADLARGALPVDYDALRDDPPVGPPAYAYQQAGEQSIPTEGKAPLWFEELNTEPQNRSAAALGAAVVRRDQEALMARAWEFAAGTRKANQLLARARLAAEVTQKTRLRLESLSDERFVQLASPAMARLPHSPGQTILGALAGSALPDGLLSGTFRRLTHSTPGFLKLEQGKPVAATETLTQAALAEPVAFTAQWATVKSPLNADVEDLVATSAAERAVGAATPPRRVGIILTPYNGNAAPALSLAQKTRAALDPVNALRALVAARISGLAAPADQPLPARARIQPRFSTAMYQRLAALSVEYLVPGVGDIPDDTLGLLENNPAFIESFLAGLNHEMGRELQWREYPAHLDDTWFQYFWQGGPGAAPDVLPIRQWSGTAGLGKHAPPGAPQASLVLLVRSALLLRYPNLRLYAVEAAWEKQAGRSVRVEAVNGAVKSPCFAATLGSGLCVFGFELEIDEARGSTNPKSHPGYFFVLEQPGGAARFGLDQGKPKNPAAAPQTWSDLSWWHLAGNDPLPAFIDVGAPPWLIAAGALPSNSDERGAKGKDTWGEDAAAMARITFQRAVRMLVHADSMLPAAGAA